MPFFEIPITVTPADVDDQGHVNNVIYVRWMQDAAAAHWQAVDGERLLARTWVGEARGATWERFIEIRRAADDKLLAHGRSVYAALDAATGRPRRVDAAIRAAFE